MDDDQAARVPVVLALSFAAIGAGRQAQRRLEGELAPLGITLRHLGALGHLARQPDVSYSDLARRAGVTAQSMNATVRQLEELGAVRREHAGHGHRARLEVTARGQELLEEAGAAAERLDAELFGHLSPELRGELHRALLGVAMPGGVPRVP